MATASIPSERRRFLLKTTVAVGTVYTVAAAYPFLASMAPSERARAAGAPVDADIANLGQGELRIVAWRGKPAWILRRTPQMLAALTTHDGLLADPDSRNSTQPDACLNPYRSLRPNVFVCLGICTHLGCSPTLRIDPEARQEFGSSWPGGFFCPCHGSKFDLAGRVFTHVPAPANLEIPPYYFTNDNQLVIGEQKKT